MNNFLAQLLTYCCTSIMKLNKGKASTSKQVKQPAKKSTKKTTSKATTKKNTRKQPETDDSNDEHPKQKRQNKK
jgi:hypothetical protein